MMSEGIVAKVEIKKQSQNTWSTADAVDLASRCPQSHSKVHSTDYCLQFLCVTCHLADFLWCRECVQYQHLNLLRSQGLPWQRSTHLQIAYGTWFYSFCRFWAPVQIQKLITKTSPTSTRQFLQSNKQITSKQRRQPEIIMLRVWLIASGLGIVDGGYSYDICHCMSFAFRHFHRWLQTLVVRCGCLLCRMMWISITTTNHN